jgi:hypothetical protein
MKIFRVLALLLIIPTSLIFSSERNASLYQKLISQEVPARTVFFKHPAAADLTAFFSKNTIYHFEVYRAGNSENLAKLVQVLGNDPAVASCITGQLTGDFQAITLTLKETKNKEWFSVFFRNAGLNTIKINNGPVTDISKI